MARACVRHRIADKVTRDRCPKADVLELVGRKAERRVRCVLFFPKSGVRLVEEEEVLSFDVEDDRSRVGPVFPEDVAVKETVEQKQGV